MKSPITGKEMKKLVEQRVWKFRGEEFLYNHVEWLCEETGMKFTTDQSDTAAYLQVTNQYRAKYRIMYTDEIVALRKKYDLSASKMSTILGMGPNQYRLYEQGEVPNLSNARLISSVLNPKTMLNCVEDAVNRLEASDYSKIINKVQSIIANSGEYRKNTYEISRIFPEERSEANGYAPRSLERLKNVLLYILSKSTDVWYTKMNKLLFYIDFLSYRENGMAISGLSYKALDFGPVPNGWDRVYAEFSEIQKEFVQFPTGEGIILRCPKDQPINSEFFTENELKIMDEVCRKLGGKTSKQLSVLSHKEKAWIDFHSRHQLIPFHLAFDIKMV